MNVRCAGCGKQVQVDPVCSSEVWPLGWQIVLNRDGEHWFCSHTCAAHWHELRSNFESPVASPLTRQKSTAVYDLEDLVVRPAGRVC